MNERVIRAIHRIMSNPFVGLGAGLTVEFELLFSTRIYIL